MADSRLYDVLGVSRNASDSEIRKVSTRRSLPWNIAFPVVGKCMKESSWRMHIGEECFAPLPPFPSFVISKNCWVPWLSFVKFRRTTWIERFTLQGGISRRFCLGSITYYSRVSKFRHICLPFIRGIRICPSQAFQFQQNVCKCNESFPVYHIAASCLREFIEQVTTRRKNVSQSEGHTHLIRSLCIHGSWVFSFL